MSSIARPAVSIVVPNWNGEAWLARCLSSLQVSARALGEPFELIVVDDASSDSSCAIVKDQFSRARLVRLDRNLGFARAVNKGARRARGRLLLLANNDLSALQDFLPRLYRHFEGTRAPFAVSAKTVGWYDGRPNQLCMGAVWRGGRITPAWSDPADPHPCLFVQAGAALYDRAKFLKLGGLSTLYEPGYWEDYDLSWRAARLGWHQIYDPTAIALHIGGGSMTRRFGAPAVARMKSRNHLLFEACHLRSPRLLLEWGARLSVGISRDFAKGMGAGSLVDGLRASAPRFSRVIAERLRLPKGRTDEQILAPWKGFSPSF